MAENNGATFVPGTFVKRQSFGKNKGEIIKLSVRVEEVKAFLDEHVNEAGYVNIDIKTSKNDNNKLYAELNTWQSEAAKEQEVEESEEEDAPF